MQQAKTTPPVEQRGAARIISAAKYIGSVISLGATHINMHRADQVK